jgi:hypothetical protein
MSGHASDRSHLPSARRPTIQTVGKLACGGIILAALFWCWYCWAADYGYSALSGSYSFSGGGDESVLVLVKNRVFRQELNHSGVVEHAQGTWQRHGEAGVTFSKEFLRAGDQPARQDVQAYGQFKKDFWGLSVSIIFTGTRRELVFRRKVGL